MTRTAFLLSLAALVCLAAPPARAQEDSDALALLPIGTSAKDSIKTGGQNETPGATLMVTAGSMTSDWHLTAKLPYDAPAHSHFFRYQRYLISKGLEGLDQKAWDALDMKAQEAKLKASEAFLKQRFTQIAAEDPLDAADKELVDAVWGVEMGAGLDKLAKARATKDPEQIKLAEQAVAALSRKLGNIKGLDAAKLFDNAAGGGAVAGPQIKDFLAPTKAQPKFLDALASPAVTAPLKNEQSFALFLASKHIPPAAAPGLMAIYQTMQKANADERKQIGHILPTVVKFLEDGHTISQADKDEGGTLGVAIPDEYGNPKEVRIFPQTAIADPILVGDTLAHEFEHIYDDYVGRAYSLDSELRGFKTNVIFMGIVKRESPEKYKQMAASPDDSTRNQIQLDAEGLMKAYARGPEDFAAEVAFGHHYNTYEQGTFEGRLPLREAADPVTGTARQLAGYRQLSDSMSAQLARAQKAYDAALKAHEAQPTQANKERVQIAAKDVQVAQELLNSYRMRVATGQIQVSALQSEARWLDAHARATGAVPPKYDLELPVDPSYTDGVSVRGASK